MTIDQGKTHFHPFSALMNSHGPSAFSSPSDIPIIDLSNVTQGIDTSTALLDAAKNWGFLYIRFRELPFSAEDINSLFDLSRTFFALEHQEKERYKITPEDRGWSAPYAETLDERNGGGGDHDNDPGDFKEAFNIGEFKDHAPRQELPESLLPKTAFLDDMQTKCRLLCLRILEGFAAALKIPKSAGGKAFFSSRHEQANGETGSILRLLYYPHTTPSKLSNTAPDDLTEPIRCGAHTDFGSMTLLFQRPGQAGLEIETPTPGIWAPVSVSPRGTENDILPPIVVNIGDMLQFWSGGLMRSTRHRVVIPRASAARDRYSIAYFCHPAKETRLVGVPSEFIAARSGSGSANEREEEEEEEEEEVITAGEHLRRKLDKAYRWNDGQKTS